MSQVTEQDKQKAMSVVIEAFGYGRGFPEELIPAIAQALANTRDEESERCAKIAEAEQENIKTDDAAFHRGHAFACHLVAAAIRRDKE